MGARITQNNFSKAKRAVEAAMERAEKSAAEDGVNIVKATVPVDPVTPDNEHIIDTIRIERNVKYTSVVAGDAKVNYAGFVEFGTEKTGAQPYMGPSVPLIQRSFQAHATAQVRRVLA